MADIVALSDALVERLLPVITPMYAGWDVRWFKPDPIIALPLLCIQPDRATFADYLQVPPAWFMRITFYLSSVDQEQSRRAMATITDQNGPVIQALQSETIDDSLWDLCPFNVVATTGKGWGLVREKRITYLEANIGVQLGAN